VRFDASGNQDTAFGLKTETIRTYTRISGAVVLSDESFIAIGWCSGNLADNDPYFLRYTSSGSRDTNFGSNGVKIIDLGSGNDASYSSVIVDEERNRAYMSGRHFVSGEPVLPYIIAVELDSGALDETWAQDGILNESDGTINADELVLGGIVLKVCILGPPFTNILAHFFIYL